MTELETLQRAKMYMDLLSRGIDPISGQVLPEDTALCQPRLERCFAYVSGVLQQVIDAGGVVRQPRTYTQKTPFSITPEQLSRVRVADEPVQISHLISAIQSAVEDPGMSRISPGTITGWLYRQGLMENASGLQGKNQRLPTDAGLRLGIYKQRRASRDGDYYAVYYKPEAQQYILDHLPEIISQA